MNLSKLLTSLGLALASLLACGKKADNSSPPPCTPFQAGDHKSFRVGWRAFKNTTRTPVDGSIAGIGHVDLVGADLTGARLEIEFDPNSIQSGLALRDERIMNVFLLSQTFNHAAFNGVIEQERAGLPKPGETIPVLINGVLSIASQELTLSLKGELFAVGGSIYLGQRTGEAVSFSLLATDYLKLNAANLLRTAAVTSMEENLEVWGNLSVVETCGQ